MSNNLNLNRPGDFYDHFFYDFFYFTFDLHCYFNLHLSPGLHLYLFNYYLITNLNLYRHYYFYGLYFFSTALLDFWYFHHHPISHFHTFILLDSFVLLYVLYEYMNKLKIKKLYIYIYYQFFKKLKYNLKFNLHFFYNSIYSIYLSS